jgi:hypothetical protein
LQRLAELFLGQPASLVQYGLESTLWNLTSIDGEGKFEVGTVGTRGDEQNLRVITASTVEGVA